ncbi:uncharacterized protein BDR25DRAFT_345229 [Lindgomyces ingoldianus]|uniref:Uncharacterized protein n=1 Tax=Lindgomyces ingoldianus TaxID=673940 RepID=A0ACB6QKG2_9PLEO|nr:uncharacterized protein BDR25DRAFT_345229 [Lindgomyces ingoldianus]KAF2467063.1 hypothetical protein BDR25DRAFT_345229 [Lindgomyces ingoldianus]
MSLRGLQELPVELLQHVISHFPNNNSNNRKTLRNLCLSSHKLRDLAQPFLFARFKPFMPNTQPDDERYLESSHHQLVGFLRTIVQRPDLALKVESLDLVLSYPAVNPHDVSGMQKVGCTMQDSTFSLDRKDEELFCDATPGSVKTIPEWQTRIQQGAYRTLLLILLSHLPNLKAIALPVAFTYNRTDGPPDQIQHMEGEQLRRLFPALQDIHITCQWSDGTLNIANFTEVLGLPTLRTFRITDCIAYFETGTYTNPLRSPPNSWNVAHIFLKSCSMGAACLVVFLNAFHCLKTFEYEAAPLDDFHEEPFKPGDVTPALQCQILSLERLSLDLAALAFDEFEDDGESLEFPSVYNHLTIGPMDSFCRLRHVRIDVDLLGGVRKLPRSLVTLILTNWVQRSSGYLDQLLNLKDTFPQIRYVFVGGMLSFEDALEWGRDHGGIVRQFLGASQLLVVPGLPYQLCLCSHRQYFHLFNEDDIEEVGSKSPFNSSITDHY